MLVDLKPAIVSDAEFGVHHAGTGFIYSEGANRLDWLHQAPFTLPWTGDCSSFVDWCFVTAGAPAPAKGDVIFTGTLITGGTEITVANTCDLVIYFDNPQRTGSGVHTALIINEQGTDAVNTADPLTISMGHQGAPEVVRVSADGRPHRFYRYVTSKEIPDPPPPSDGLPKPVTFTTQKPNALLKRGMWGWQVRWLQLALGQTTHFPYWFGKTTQAKLGNFQRTRGLPKTGTTTPETWKKLGA